MTTANRPCSVCGRKVCTDADRNTDGTYTCRDCLYQHSAQPTPPAAPTAPPRTPPTA